MSDRRSQRERLLDMIQERHPGYHPLIAMADLAHEAEDERLRFDCHKTIAKFVEPELRSIEVRGDGTPIGINIITVSDSEGRGRDLIDDMSDARRRMLEAIEGEAEVVEQRDVEDVAA